MKSNNKNQQKLRIYLLDLVHDYFFGNFTIPLNIGLLAAYLKSKYGNEIDVKLFKSPQILLKEFSEEEPPHIVAFSNYSWNQQLNKNIVSIIKSKVPEIVICAGGPHIRMDEKGISDYLKKHYYIDYYCMFEGEQPLGNIIEYFLKKNKVIKKELCDITISGVAYVTDKLVYKPIQLKKGVIEDIPSPYLIGLMDEFLENIQLTPIFETNRGCPYQCVFCVWGVSAQNKLRQFPLERVYEEMEYVAKRSKATRWLFADANFGILKRDIEIAQEIKKIADKYGVLKFAHLQGAKNVSERTKEIARVLGPLWNPLIAVQSMDLDVLERSKRKNIKLDPMIALLKHFQSKKIDIHTDVLAGLPGESFESHIQTLRRVTELNFDLIDVGNIRLLPGSEYENEEFREQYSIVTKYRLISRSYGVYGDKNVFEFEESVRATNEITEGEMFSLRLIHFLLWAFWNLGIAKPLLRWIFKVYKKNPVDIILEIIKNPNDKSIEDFFTEFNQEAKKEWFDTEDDIINYYSKYFDVLLKNGFLKMNQKYLAKILLDKSFAKHLLETISEKFSGGISNELVHFCLERIFFPDSKILNKRFTYSDDTIDALKLVYPNISFESNICNFVLNKSTYKAIEFDLNRFQYKIDPLVAVTITLDSHSMRFFYDIGLEPDTDVFNIDRGNFQSGIITQM